jgi:hypothetical protein
VIAFIVPTGVHLWINLRAELAARAGGRLP